MKSKIILSIFALFLFSAGCDEDSCSKALSWESASSVGSVNIDLKSGAGEKCENYNDYYEGDLNQIITKIQSMKVVIKKKCYDEGVEAECPEFVPGTIEFGELVGCSFGTPPAENTSCMAGPLKLSFGMKTFAEEANWMFDEVENPKFVFGESSSLENSAFGASKGDIYMAGYFNDANLTTATIVFTWTEGTEEKTLELSATVETKE